MSRYQLFVTLLVLATIVTPIPVMAEDGLYIEVSPTVACDGVTFEVKVGEGTPPYNLVWDFGDGDLLEENDIKLFPHLTNHKYLVPGDYEWVVTVTDSSEIPMTGMTSDIVTVGPLVTLLADEMPPIAELEGGEATFHFTAEVVGGVPPFFYEWSFEGASSFTSDPNSNTASATYTKAGRYTASVTVTDECGSTHTDTLLVVVVEPLFGCHPMAQRIADEVSKLFPDQAETIYTCEDIYYIFLGGLTGRQTGFGRLWHAYQLALTIEDLTWEQIRDWHLDGTGWGLLVQLNRYAEAIDDVGIVELVDRVLSGENSANQIRTALRCVLRYDADFEEALARLADGISPGKLGQLYRTAQELDLDPGALDSYLEMGINITELRHAAKLATQLDDDWASLIIAHSEGYNWGEIRKAYQLADETTSALSILGIGVQEFRQQLRMQTQEERQTGFNHRIATHYAYQYGVGEGDILVVFNEICDGDWKCVHDYLRENPAIAQQAGSNERTATHLALQYGVSEEEIMSLFEGTCDGDWSCVRSQLRDRIREEHGKGKD
ncbi:MAG TPA: PKD domain-containing protein [Anaerolineae bacterium]|nr:PKD domain-containing protein [Anaerolineae bacterium]